MPPALATPSGFGANAVRDIAAALNLALADVFALYLKTKNFHWHMSGPHFRDYHLLLDEQGDQIFAMTDVLAERVRKVGGVTLHSIGEISRNQRIFDNDAPFVTPQDMLAELREDNATLAKSFRAAHEVADEHGDVGTTVSSKSTSTRQNREPGSSTKQAASRRTRLDCHIKKSVPARGKRSRFGGSGSRQSGRSKAASVAHRLEKV